MWNTIMACMMSLAASCAFAQPNGADIYANKCAACHQAGGAGTPGLAPPLVGNIGQRATSPDGREYITKVVLNGMAGTITVDGVRYSGAMPSQGTLSDADIAAILVYVLKDVEKVEDLAWLTPEYVASMRRAGGTPNETHKLRSKLSTASR